MKSAHVFRKSEDEFEVRIKELPIPEPSRHEVRIRVVVSGTNPKDWKQPLRMQGLDGFNSGDDIAGYVDAVGAEIKEFRRGDRVAAMHQMRTAHGSFAEYAIAPENSTFHVPDSISFEEAATIPLAAMTSAVGIFCRLGLPEPWVTTSQARNDALAGGVIVYGAASAVGAFAVKLLTRAAIHPIICVAGRGKAFVEGLIDASKGDAVIDYRDGHERVVAGIRAAIPNRGRLMYAFDAVSENNSYRYIVEAIDLHGHLSTVLPAKGIPETLQRTLTTVGSVHGSPDDLSDFGYAWFRLFSLGLKEGWLRGHPYEVVPGGLYGVQTGLDNLKNGKASALKYVCRIDETNTASTKV